MRQKSSYSEVSAVHKFKHEETHLYYKEAEKAVKVSKRLFTRQKFIIYLKTCPSLLRKKKVVSAQQPHELGKFS